MGKMVEFITRNFYQTRVMITHYKSWLVDTLLPELSATENAADSRLNLSNAYDPFGLRRESFRQRFNVARTSHTSKRLKPLTA